MFKINTTDPSQNSYYYPILLLIFIILILIELLILAIKNHIDLNIEKNNNNTLFSNVSYSMTFIKNKNSLKIRYLVCYIFARAAMWAKAPYLYTLFATVHKFTMGEISNLYLIDAVAAFIFGPITGQLADIYGRRFFCHIYNLSIILNLLLRMAGTKPLAYLSQIITGLGAGLINTTFEAWVVAEAQKDFGAYELERDRFLKKLFRTANIIDATMSILISGICAIIYSVYGIYAPFWISIGLSALAIIASAILWGENKPMANSKDSPWKQFSDACLEFKKTEVLCIGVIEGIVMAVLNIFLFSWTPILKTSTKGGINVGFIFTCMVLTMIIGTKSYEVVVVNLGCDYYLSITASCFIEFLLFMIVYNEESFFIRLINIALINGIQGFYNPLNSIIKSKILKEKYRALLMNIFRIPLNLYVIIILFVIKYMEPLSIAFLAGMMCFLSFLIGLYLYYWKFKTKKGITNIVEKGFIFSGNEDDKKNILNNLDENENNSDEEENLKENLNPNETETKKEEEQNLISKPNL